MSPTVVSAEIVVTNPQLKNTSIYISKTGQQTAVISLGDNARPYKLYDIIQTDADSLMCRAEAPGVDPSVTIDVDGRFIVIRVVGTMFGMGDQRHAFNIGPANRQKLADFLKLAAFPRVQIHGTPHP